ncbi:MULTISPECIES: hypothetical protein [unclassified Serratia (in: enterobacteria)]|uniref:hypothetical protein n=1 Tax=unclassified Serratia (in: enterobacteria) TaxID=2647522 RepID=UPI003B432509
MATQLSFWSVLSAHSFLEVDHWLWPVMVGVGGVLALAWGGIFMHNVRKGAVLRVVLWQWLQAWLLPCAFIAAGVLLVVSGGDWLAVVLDSADWAVRRWMYELQVFLGNDTFVPIPPSLLGSGVPLLPGEAWQRLAGVLRVVVHDVPH